MRTDAVEQLISEHGGEIFNFCFRLTMNQADAEDLYQDTFVKVLQMPQRLERVDREAAASVRAELSRRNRNFLMGIAANLWRNRRRKRKREPLSVSVDQLAESGVSTRSTQDIETEAVRREALQRLSAHVEELPDKIKLVTCMFYTAEMKVQEIADALHIPSGTVKSRLHQARAYLKMKMEADGYEI